MFTVAERASLRDELVAAARADPRITGAALTGSAAVGAEDRWSDVDLAFGVGPGVEMAEVIADYTGRMYADHGAVDHLDVPFGATVYRVFLLANTLQVDLAFGPEAEFGAVAPTFRPLFGTPVRRPQVREPEPAQLVGTAWLYALHARSSIARCRWWQAEYMVSGVRDRVLALACRRHGLPATEGRGMDRLPAAETAVLAGALVRAPELAELVRAFRVAVDCLLAEARHVDPALADRLAAPLAALTAPDPRPAGGHPDGVLPRSS